MTSGLVACSSPPTKPETTPRPAIASASATTEPAASAPSALPKSATPPPDQTGPERLAAALAPKGQEDALLLLGVHLESIEGYAPMFSSEGKPRTDTKPGYRTLIVRTHAGSADVVGELPFLAIPQGDGFLFMGESSVSVHLPEDPRVTLFDGSPKPRDYDATDLWKTSNAKEISTVQRELERGLKRAQAWGTENTTQIVYVTQRSICTTQTQSEVTGGALYFYASSRLNLSGVGTSTILGALSAHLDEKKFIGFAARLVETEESEIDLDRPYMYNTFDLVVWRDDIAACLAHDAGALSLTGSVRFSANSARSFYRTKAVGPAPPTLAPGHEAVDFSAIAASIPDAFDAFVSPAHDVVLAVRQKGDGPVELVVWDVVARREVKVIPMPGRPVMDEWATGETKDRWSRLLAPHTKNKRFD
ncbi:MAG: hypothetical protein HOW73_29740 [Polyangiaceae bacterium]|nr:hypothetical protein [Polyangiaceae bacterium]